MDWLNITVMVRKTFTKWLVIQRECDLLLLPKSIDWI